jgi:AcrR family transcriptional regulator
VSARVEDPRCIRSRATILDAAADLLAAGGLHGFSMDDVAARAGVGKATIYRHWRTRDDLVVDVTLALCSPVEAPDSGSLHDDVLALLRRLAARVNSAKIGPVMAAVIDGAERSPALRRVHERIVLERRAPMREVLERAQARGEARRDVSVDLAVDLAVAPVFYRRFVAHQRVDQRYLTSLVDVVCAVLAPAPEPAPVA